MIAAIFQHHSLSTKKERKMASDQNLILEIEEAIKREKTEKLFKEYGPYILAGALLAVLFTGIISGYRHWESRVNSENTAKLMSALTQPDQVSALQQVAPELRPGPRAIAQMTAAGTLMAQNKPAEARKIYETVAGDKALPAIYRDLATLTTVRLDLSGDAKAADAAGLLAQLAPLMGNKKSAWRAQAHIEAALIKAHLQNDYAGARTTLAAVLEEAANLPAAVVSRARALDQVFGQKTSALKPAADKSDASKSDAPKSDAQG